MQAIGETVFDALYLCSVTLIGIYMIRNARGQKQYVLFGIMAVTLGCGDAFHLIPRAYALLTTGLEANAAALGVGKFITSITMTIFYVILYHIYRYRYKITGQKGIAYSIYVLAILRIILCLFPQNEWLSYHSSFAWGIYRNFPFALLGLIILVLYYRAARNDGAFRWMWFAIVLSFGFYIPVVLWAETIPVIGALMIPKTLAYVWIVWMGFHELRNHHA